MSVKPAPAAPEQNTAPVPFFLSDRIGGEGEIKFPNEPPRFHRKDVERFFIWATEQGASDITIRTGEQIFLEIDGKMVRGTRHFLDNAEVLEMVVAMYGSESAKATLAGVHPLDFQYQVNKDRDTKYRFRISAVGAVVNGSEGCEITARTIPSIPPALKDLNIEDGIVSNMAPKQGMIVVAGATGSGKSTLLASIIRHLLEDPNGNRKIITFEAPIEYVYDEVDCPSSIITQSEIHKNLENFVEATRNALRRKPNVILLGEARDAETIGEAVTASMTGHLLYTTVHANGFSATIRRMVNVFNEDKNARAVDIVSSLRMVICQRLVPATNGKRIALREYVVLNDEIVDFILDAGVDQITASCRQVLKEHGQSFLEDATLKLKQGLISHKVWKEIARQSKADDADAAHILHNFHIKQKLLSGIDKILEPVADLRVSLPELASDVVLEKNRESSLQYVGASLEQPEWPSDQPELKLSDEEDTLWANGLDDKE